MNVRRTLLISELKTLNKELDQLIDFLSSFTEDQLNQRENPNAWSALQAMNHLILSETYALKYCLKKLSFNPELKEINIKSRFNSALLSFYLKVPIKIKAPKAVGTESLPEKDTLENVMKLWKESREKLNDFINTVDEKYLSTEVYKHPFGMRISIKGMLSFFKSHFRRHRKQILRVLRN